MSREGWSARSASESGVEGYGPAEIRRLWTIVSYQRDLGINLAGVEAVLRLFDRMVAVHRRVGGLADELREIAEETSEPEPHEPPAGDAR